LHTYYIRNTLVGRLTPRSARGRLQDKPEQLCFFSVLHVTHPKSYIEMTDRHDFGGKPSKWRWGRVLSWKIPEFYSVGEARSQKQHFSRFQGTLRLSCAVRTTYRKQFYPKPMVPMESRDSEGVPFANLDSGESV